ncbi:hypothetical protein NDU88_009663, partial [Pleurodeles waltl]
ECNLRGGRQHNLRHLFNCTEYLRPVTLQRSTVPRQMQKVRLRGRTTFASSICPRAHFLQSAR